MQIADVMTRDVELTRPDATIVEAAKLMAKGPWDVNLLTELSTAMRDASICGLGQAAPNPLMCVLKYFPEELTKPMGTW